MAKKRFAIKAKLTDKPVTKPKKLPVQDISPEEIAALATNKPTSKKTKPSSKAAKKTTPKQSVKRAPAKKQSKAASAQKKRPQGRPPRTEPVKRLSSDLPAELYDKVKDEVRMNGYSLNGFLAKVIREYFERKEGF